MQIYTPAKLNLSLHIVGKKRTAPFAGYHLIESLVSFVDICDTITLVPNTNGTIDITTSGDFCHLTPISSDNLVARAIDMIRPCDSYGCAVHIHKILPVGGGIGSGSSNAGATLNALTKLWHTPRPTDKNMAALGADVPVCYYQQHGVMTGIGDRFTPVRLPRYYVVIACPRISIMTPHIYKHFATHGTFSTAPNIPDNMDYDTFIKVLQQGQNDLMPVCVSLYPQVQQCLNSIYATNADYVAISGSGACCFGIYKRKKCAENALNIIKKHNFWAKLGTNI